MYSSSNFEEGLRIINDFVARYDERGLTPREEAIILGSLEGLTYQDMKKEDSRLYYTVEYISRNLAPALWNKLTELVEKSPLIEENFRVRKNQVWYLVEQINRVEFKTDSTSIDFSPQSMEGKILLDRYVIEEHLFERDSGERHFSARDRCMGNQPCLVIQRCHQTSRIQQQFEREAEILSELGQHPQIPQLLAYFKQGQCLYLVYEQISGQPLTELLTQEPWSESAVILLLRNLLNVLEFIQQSNVIHRNLNPDNIIQVGDRLILIDFATVKEIVHRDRSIVSRSTFAEGRKECMRPEQLTGFTTFASDIYAIGSIAIHALTGIHPHRLRINPQTGNLIWRDVKEVEVSDCLAEIIDRATDHYFLNRYQSAAEMLANLNNLIE